MTEKIVAMAKALGAGEEQEELLSVLCQAAQRELEGRLRPELTPEDCESAFVPAAAWMALAWLNTGTGGEGITSFTAGDVTIRREGGRESAALLDQAQRLMAPYLRDGGFAFLGVRG